MHTIRNGYLVLKNHLNFSELQSESGTREVFGSHKDLREKYLSNEDNFRPNITVDHYLLTKNKADSLLRSFLPLQETPDTSTIVNLLKKRQKKRRIKSDGTESLLNMAKEASQKLNEKRSESEIIAQQYNEIMSDSISRGTLNMWMNNPEHIVAVYRTLLAKIQGLSELTFPQPLRLAGDCLIYNELFSQAKGYNCCMSQYPCYQPWKRLLDELHGNEEHTDISAWSSIVVWIFYSSMTPEHGGIHFLKNSHKKICEEGYKKSLDVSTVTSHPFLPMQSHIGMNSSRFGLETLEVDSYMSFGEGTVILMHPATAYCTSVNMSTIPASSQQLYLMRDGSCGPCSPHTDESWYGRWSGGKESKSLNDPHLFPIITPNK